MCSGSTQSKTIKILKSLNKEDLVNLIKICRQYTRHKATFYLVFKFCKHYLAGRLSNIKRVRASSLFTTFTKQGVQFSGWLTLAWSGLLPIKCPASKTGVVAA